MFDEISNGFKQLKKDIKESSKRVKVLLFTVISLNFALKLVFLILVGVALYAK